MGNFAVKSSQTPGSESNSLIYTFRGPGGCEICHTSAAWNVDNKGSLLG